jgi:hypothetical protein
MDKTRVDALLKVLVPLLPGLCHRGASSAEADGAHAEELADPSGADVDRAVREELRHIICHAPDAKALQADQSTPQDIARAEHRLRELLTQGDDHAVKVLWALLAGRDEQPPPEALQGATASTRDAVGRRRGRTKLARPNGWLRRQVAGVWMNILIAAVLLMAWLFAWPPAGGPPVGVVALSLFAVWALSFLPSWLYVRFLGQRAGALWTEYVLTLHRLAWDRPGHLPKPPLSSEFYAEWFKDGGLLFAHRQTIYRQKFDAYYGKSVSESSDRPDSHVKIETLFPVFLLTATLAVCWTAVLWDPSFVQDPGSVWDVLKFGFVGAYSFIFQMLIRRFFQNDLRPSAYAHSVLRIIVVLLVVTALYQVLPTNNLRTQAVVAFVVGFFPLVGMQALQRIAAGALRAAVPSLSPPYPLSQIDGLSVWYEARLLEEGIEDMQSLATANFVDVILHTRVPVGRLVDWVDQAHLYLHFDRIERGWMERRLAGRRNRAASGRTDATPPTPAAASNGAGSATATDGIAHGSVTTTSRAGTRTRTALRQFGIRKATDLLNAFPPQQMDPDVPIAPGSPWEAHLSALKQEGLDIAQVRTMVRVLSHESSLAPVWNWYRRGVRERNIPERLRPHEAGLAPSPRAPTSTGQPRVDPEIQRSRRLRPDRTRNAMLTRLLTGRAATPRDERIQDRTTLRDSPSSKA